MIAARPTHIARHAPWHGFAKLWREPEPPDFHWRLLRYFCWTRVAVGLLLLAYTIMERGAETHGVSVVLPFQLALPAHKTAAMQLAMPYLGIALAMLAGTLWRRRFHLRVRLQVLADLVLLGLIYETLGRNAMPTAWP